MPEHAGSTSIGYETGNALGAVWETAPRLAGKLTRMHNYALAVQTYLRALDFYCYQTGTKPWRVRVDTSVRDGAIVQRITRR